MIKRDICYPDVLKLLSSTSNWKEVFITKRPRGKQFWINLKLVLCRRVVVINYFLIFQLLGSIYRVSQEECARLQEGVPYVEVYRYNPKHLCPKLNGYGDNGQRKVWSYGVSHTVPISWQSYHVRPWVWCHMMALQLTPALNCICTSFRVMT